VTSLSHTELDTYRLIVTRRNASELLLVPGGSDWLLPRVEILPRRRVAEQLSVEAQARWRCESYCLFLPNLPEPNRSALFAVMESVTHNGNAPAGTFWLPASAVRRGAAVREEHSAIAESLEELDSYASLRKPGPFAKPGWLRELFRWVQERITPLGLRVTGKFKQFNASPTFSLIRLETSGPAVWFKATGEPNRHELSITVMLAGLFPGYVPAILGVHEAWNAWLSMAATGGPLDKIEEISEWERVARELAEFQILSIAKTAELLECHCKDLRLPKLKERIDPFCARMAELMAVQKKESPAPLSEPQLTFLGVQLKQALGLLSEVGLPDTLGHVDFNPGNILLSHKRCVFLDWAEGCVSNPLITFEYLREHLSRSQVKDADAEHRISTAYLRSWHAFFSPSDLARARTVSPMVAVFAYAVASDTWNSTTSLSNPRIAEYLRSLTRRMYREAMQIEGGHA
jgi:hypothetical protein